MVAALLLSEDWFGGIILLLRTAALLLSAGTLWLSGNRRSFRHRVLGLSIAALLALAGYGLLEEDTPYKIVPPTGRYIVATLCLPVLVGLYTTIFWPRKPPGGV